ncbi:hypothetical protein RHOER0001_4862 [Rhodococcus erythropolis SK121]|nr:hypothetical protein RHOER0001_4862 [Rhodococcus erythropolis SK121]
MISRPPTPVQFDIRVELAPRRSRVARLSPVVPLPTGSCDVDLFAGGVLITTLIGGLLVGSVMSHHSFASVVARRLSVPNVVPAGRARSAWQA